jgi:drug/metabolite transporter (DMT)-like permease
VREPASAARLAGLLLGLIGVVGLAWDRLGGSAPSAEASAMIGIGLCLLASALYGFSANFARQALSGVQPLAVAAGSQLAAGLVLALPAASAWPVVNPPPQAWLAVAALALLSTGLAYVLYFRLIARIGPAKAITVTFLVPAFAMAWAGLFLGEAVTPAMLAACAVILLGTGLATGLLTLPWPRHSSRPTRP